MSAILSYFTKASSLFVYSLALKAFKRMCLDLRGWKEFKSHGNIWSLKDQYFVQLSAIIVTWNIPWNKQTTPPHTKKKSTKEPANKKINLNPPNKNSRKKPNLQAFHTICLESSWTNECILCFCVLLFYLELFPLPVTTSVYRFFYFSFFRMLQQNWRLNDLNACFLRCDCNLCFR